MHWSWDDAWATNTRIDAWAPPRRLVLAEERPAFDANGRPIPGSRAARLVMEFTLEARQGGTTRLRLVHSGFATDAGWDDELDATSAGWNVELRNLRHYLEQHRGQGRIHAKAQRTISAAADEVLDQVHLSRVWSCAPGGGAPFTATRGSFETTSSVLLISRTPVEISRAQRRLQEAQD